MTERHAVRERLPVQRVGSPGDVAAAIVLLAGNGFITESTLIVDGGGTLT